MLIGVNPILGPEILYTLRNMGHGDTLTLVWTASGWAIVGRQSGVANGASAFDGPVIG